MGCPPVRGDNPRALASGLSYVQVDKHGITIYTTYISVDIVHHEIFHAKVGKSGIKLYHARIRTLGSSLVLTTSLWLVTQTNFSYLAQILHTFCRL